MSVSGVRCSDWALSAPPRALLHPFHLSPPPTHRRVFSVFGVRFFFRLLVSCLQFRTSETMGCLSPADSGPEPGVPGSPHVRRGPDPVSSSGAQPLLPAAPSSLRNRPWASPSLRASGSPAHPRSGGVGPREAASAGSSGAGGGRGASPRGPVGERRSLPAPPSFVLKHLFCSSTCPAPRPRVCA